ncbi:MAG: hypothetical protein R3240_13905 [Gammaproteobacteria bacterium]|nr:hypothetical protein [Gammaproteobacteria bacterium]
MIDPVDLDNFFIAFFSAAMIILMGAAYALFFAFGKLQGRKLFFLSAYLSYGFLAISVFFLSDALNLNGYWQVLVWLMLAGYLLAPHGIWHLCRGTHADPLESGSINDFRG